MGSPLKTALPLAREAASDPRDGMQAAASGCAWGKGPAWFGHLWDDSGGRMRYNQHEFIPKIGKKGGDVLRKYTNTKEGVMHPAKMYAVSGKERSSPRSSWRPGCNWKACRSTKRPSAASRPGSGWWRIMSCSIWQRFCGCEWKTCLGWINAAELGTRRVFVWTVPVSGF